MDQGIFYPLYFQKHYYGTGERVEGLVIRSMETALILYGLENKPYSRRTVRLKALPCAGSKLKKIYFLPY